MRNCRLGLFLASWFGITGFFIFVPELARGQGEDSVLVAQDEDLAEAERLNQQVFQFGEQGKYNEAIPLAEKVLAIRQRILGNDHPDVAVSLDNLAVLYHTQGRYSEAETLYLQSLEMLKHLLGEEHPGVATSLNALALLYKDQGKYKKAETYFLQALEMRKRLLGEEHPDVAQSLNNLAGLYHSQGSYKEAETYFLQALEMRKRLLGEEHPDVAQSLNNLAGLYHSQGSYKEAETYFLQALEMRKRLLGEEHPNIAASFNNLAALYESQGRYEEAEDYYLQSLEMLKRLLGEEHPSVAASLHNLAGLYKNQGSYKEAETYFLQALEMLKRLLGEEHSSVAKSLSNLALLYHSQGRYSEAETYYLQSLEMLRNLLGEEHPSVAKSLSNLALLYYSQGRYKEAETYYLQSLEMKKRLLGEEHPSVALALNNLAALYHSQGRYKEAETYYLQSLEMRKRLLGEEHPDVAQSLNNLAALYSAQGKYSEAETSYLQALEMRKRLLGEEHPSVATSLNNLAVLYKNQGRYSEAETYQLQSLEMKKRLLGEEHPSVATSLNNLAVLYKNQGRYSEAETSYLQALEIDKRILGEEHPSVATGLSNLAGLYWAQEKTSLAITLYTQSLEIGESNLIYNLFAGFERQKRNYLNKIARDAHMNLSLHLNSAPNNPQAANLAFNTVLQRKGRVLNFFSNSLQILRQRLETKDQKLLGELTITYSQLANLIYNRPEKLPLEQYKVQVALLEEKVKKLERELSNLSQEFRQEFQTPNITSVQKLIPAETALLEFVKYRPYNPKTNEYSQPHYAAYILTPKGEPQGIDLGETTTIEQAVKLFRYSLADAETPEEQLQETARKLDQLVMEPVRQVLGNSKQLLVSPQAALNLIPFEALVDEQGQYLVENYSFTYLTSGRDLLKLSEPTPNEQPSLVVANPNFEVPGQLASLPQPNQESSLVVKPEVPGQLASLPPKTQTRSLDLDHIPFIDLPGTEAEGKAIAKKLGITPLMNSQATEAAIKQVNSPKILHIATHGFFQTPEASNLDDQTYQDNPLLLSGLVLAGFRTEQSGSDEDGILTAQEVSALNLFNTKLVVFSACDTGLGALDAGEGLYSLRRALVIAGAESQVISLWKVEDNATKELMVSYYDKILANQGRSEALRKTQLEMLNSEDHSHPHYWAAFIPSGNWRPIE